MTDALAWPAVLAALEDAFRDPGRFDTPERVMMPAPQGGSFLTMPCADAEGWFGVKQVAVLPGNRDKDKPGVQAHYTLFDPDGTPVLSCAATLLTRMRTSAVSALAARRLAPERVRSLLVVGTGGLAPWMAEAHLQVRPYEQVMVWGRRPEAAQATAQTVLERMQGEVRPSVRAVASLEEAVRQADVVAAATSSNEPLVRGEWLAGDRHVDLVGAFRADMAEVDAQTVIGASVYVDERSAAMAEAGDLIRAREAGWSFDRVRGDLHEVVTGRAGPRAGVTLFKSVGLAFEDLVLAKLLA